jgi:hypothetical protein
MLDRERLCSSKLAARPSVRARVEEIQAENEAECRWGRKQLLDFYRDCLERGAGTLTADDRLCQGVEETTVTHYNGKGEPVRLVHKRRLIMPAKMEAADGVRRMLGLQYKVLSEDMGNSPKAADIVVVNYRGALINGKEFDSSYKSSRRSR